MSALTFKVEGSSYFFLFDREVNRMSRGCSVRGCTKVRFRIGDPSTQSRLLEQRQSLPLKRQHSLFVKRPVQKRAVDSGRGQGGQPSTTCSLVPTSGNAPQPAMKWALSFLKAPLDGKGVDTQASPSDFPAATQSPFLMNIMSAENPWPPFRSHAARHSQSSRSSDFAAILLASQAPICSRLSTGRNRVVIVELDECDVGIFGGEVLALACDPPAFMIAG